MERKSLKKKVPIYKKFSFKAFDLLEIKPEERHLVTEQLCKFLLALSWMVFQMYVTFYQYFLTRHETEVRINALTIILKGTLVPAVGLCWYFLSPVHQKIMYAYVLCAAIGDILLLRQEFLIYATGGCFFFISHVLITIRFGIKWRQVPWYAYLMMIPNLTLIGYFLVPELIKMTMQSVTFGLYAFFLELGACSAVARIYKYGFKSLTYWLGVCGYFCFLISDVILLRGRVVDYGGANVEMEIMGSYAIAQVLLLWALAIDPLQMEPVAAVTNPMAEGEEGEQLIDETNRT